MSATKAALLGFGVVGSEVYGYFQESPVIDIRSVLVQDRSKSRPYKVSGEERVLDPDILASSFEAILQDEEIKVVIELTGSPNADSEFILPALQHRKHIVTANKQAILNSWGLIAATAAANGVIVRYDATVGGGVPIIRCFEQHLSQDKISRVFGILNGTCNFILSGMRDEMLTSPTSNPKMQTLIELAQKDGLAEPDPRADLDGSDTRRKIAILTNLAFGTTLASDDVYCEGIRDYEHNIDIEAADFEFAAKLMNPTGEGYVIKLLGMAEYIPTKGSVMAAVHPCMIPANHLLANVWHAFNGVVIKSDRLETQFMYGVGAGAKATAISIAAGVHDILDGRSLLKPRKGVQRLEPFGSVVAEGLFRSYSPDVPRVFHKKLEVISEEHGINVEKLENMKKAQYLQFVEVIDGTEMMPDYIVISETENSKIHAALDSLRNLPDVKKVSFIRLFKD